MSALANFLKMLENGKDNALLRFGIGSEYLKLEQPSQAVSHLQRAVALDPGYSAAWKLLGRALTDCGRKEEALSAYEQGIGVAQAKGDKQAAKEMEVFARRLRKN
ncbi:MAG: tetratricopeptide repeat protein [Betaproteobacteria bacterium]|nr:tetratricopeptide repeat protein [Betaproteobacteria bacterium]